VSSAVGPDRPTETRENMDQTSLRPFSRSAHRSFLAISVASLLGATLSAGGCSNQLASPPSTLTPDGSAIGSGGTAGLGVQTSAGSTLTSNSSSATSSTVSTVVTSTAVTSSASTSSVGVGTVGTGSGGTGGIEVPETSAAVGTGTGTGTGTGSGGTGVVEEPCEDVEPPPDPEWPGATCADWATSTPECGEAWFKDYCDISCGRCVPEGGLPPVPMAPDCSGEGLPNVSGGEGFATRYWDCCQPHCSQFDGHRCSQDGTSRTGDSNSACNGGGSFACYDEAPRAVTECLAYGHMAKSNPNCGGCYRIQFTGEGEHNANDPGSKLIKGKQMIVKVTNTGGDVAGNQFDLMIPGGGVGQFNACSRQWGTSDLGAQYGGFLTECTGAHSAKKECVRQECMKIPAGPARDGCIWFVDWFQVADNPKFTSQPTDCPF